MGVKTSNAPNRNTGMEVIYSMQADFCCDLPAICDEVSHVACQCKSDMHST